MGEAGCLEEKTMKTFNLSSLTLLVLGAKIYRAPKLGVADPTAGVLGSLFPRRPSITQWFKGEPYHLWRVYEETETGRRIARYRWHDQWDSPLGASHPDLESGESAFGSWLPSELTLREIIANAG
jgi:hypothetical protein